MSGEPKLIRLDMVGERRLYERDVLIPIIKSLRAAPLFAPDNWGLDERTKHPFDEERIALSATGESSPYVLQLSRRKRLRHTTFMRLSDRPGVTVSLPASTPPRDWHHLFELGDSLAEAYRPDLAWVHLSLDLEPPLEDDDARTRYVMDSGIVGSGPAYEDDGPGGLGLRTYIGPRLVEQFGRALLLSAPCPTLELTWGGIRLDLVDQPWAAPTAELAAAWRAAMDHLRPARVFSEAELDEDGYVYFRPGDRFDPGRRG